MQDPLVSHTSKVASTNASCSSSAGVPTACASAHPPTRGATGMMMTRIGMKASFASVSYPLGKNQKKQKRLRVAMGAI